MAMDFWEAKRRARTQTLIYLFFFAFLTIMAAVLLEVGLRYFDQDQYNPPQPILGISFLLLTFGAATIQYVCFMSCGGKYVAESVGARLADPTASPTEAQLINIVEECAIASSLPIPAVYIMEAKQINAFAAGLTPQDAVIAVTQGALNNLTRDEMQGVVAHEFGHICNGDMKIGLRLSAMLMGFYFILYFAIRMMQFSGGSRRSNEKGSNPVAIAALLMILAGAFTWFFGSILKAAVNRQREYLADASSVQFTRNPQGLVNALQKIQKESVHDMPKTGLAYSQLYLDDRSSFSSIFATHPPLDKRIDAIVGCHHVPKDS